MEFYLHFSLAMDRSPGFGSNTTNFAPCSDSLASYIHSPDHSTIGTRSHFDVLSALVSTRFQVLFHSPPGVLFTFPSQYCFAIGHWVVFRLGGWSPHLPTGFHVSGGTLDSAAPLLLRLHDFHILRFDFPVDSARITW